MVRTLALEHRLAAVATTPAGYLQRTLANPNVNVTNSAECTELSPRFATNGDGLVARRMLRDKNTCRESRVRDLYAISIQKLY